MRGLIPVGEARERLRLLRHGRERAAGSIQLSLDGVVAELVLDNPGARHALTLGMMEDLAEAVSALSAWDGCAVLIRSTGSGAFCAGGHLGQVRAFLGEPEAGREMATAMGSILEHLSALPVVSVAALTGPAVGGGLELCTAADFRWAAPRAWLEARQARLGVAAGWGGAARLVRLMGRRHALRMLVEGARLTATEAASLGLVDEVVEAPVESARAWLAELAARPEGAVHAVKRQVVGADDAEAQVDAFVSVWGDPPIGGCCTATADAPPGRLRGYVEVWGSASACAGA